MKYNKLLILFLFILLISKSFAEIVPPSIEKKYPPYQDIWGYDLSEYQAAQNNDLVMTAYKMDDGDIWFEFRSYAHRIENPAADKDGYVKIFDVEKYRLLKFFAGSNQELSESDRKYLNRITEDKMIGGGDEYHKITFQDGSTLEIVSEHVGKRCLRDNIKTKYLVKKNASGEEIGKYSILIASSKIEKIEDFSHPLCRESGPYVTKQLDFLPQRLIKLSDDTFIVYSVHKNLMVRLDKNLNTKFTSQVAFKTRDGKTLTRDFFVIPYSLVKDTIRKVSEEGTYADQQGLHEGLIDYFIKQQEITTH